MQRDDARDRTRSRQPKFRKRKSVQQRSLFFFSFFCDTFAIIVPLKEASSRDEERSRKVKKRDDSRGNFLDRQNPG